MINFDDVAREDSKEHNLNWPHIPDPEAPIINILYG